MSQGDKRLVWNLRERILSADLVRGQALAAAEKAGLLRSFYDDTLGDWFDAPGLQSLITSSTPSLLGDVYGGLMVQPDNAAYFLVQPGSIGVLEPTGLGPDDSPYRVVVDPGVSVAGALPFTSNAGGVSPRWDVVECQPVDRVLEQQTRDIYNPATGVVVPTLVDKVRAGQLNYRVRVGTPGSGFPGVAAGWLPLAVVCAPAGSNSLLTSDVWDVRPLVRERVKKPHPVDPSTGTGFAPIPTADYRFITQTENKWNGVAESEFNGYAAGGMLTRSTPSTLAQFGLTTAGGGRFASLNADLVDNQASYTLGANTPVYLVALFPVLLPRWQRYSQVPVGTGRVPAGPRGFLVATTTKPAPNGVIKSMPLPTAAQFGGGSVHAGCLLASTMCSAGSAPLLSSAAASIHHWTDAPNLAGTIVGADFRFDFDPTLGTYWPPSARRVLYRFVGTSDNTGGTNSTGVLVQVVDLSTSQVYATLMNERRPMTSGVIVIDFAFWAPVLPRLTPAALTFPGNMRVVVNYNTQVGHISSSIRCLGWSSADS